MQTARQVRSPGDMHRSPGQMQRIDSGTGGTRVYIFGKIDRPGGENQGRYEFCAMGRETCAARLSELKTQGVRPSVLNCTDYMWVNVIERSCPEIKNRYLTVSPLSLE